MIISSWLPRDGFSDERKFPAEFIKGGAFALPPSLIDYPTFLIIRNLPELYSLGNLRSVSGILRIEGCASLASVGDLKIVGGTFTCRGAPQLRTLQGLRRIVDALNVAETGVETLPEDLAIELWSNRPPIILLKNGSLTKEDDFQRRVTIH